MIHGPKENMMGGLFKKGFQGTEWRKLAWLPGRAGLTDMRNTFYFPFQ